MVQDHFSSGVSAPPLFSTAYFPPVAYMAALVRCDCVWLEVKETYPRRTYRNRALVMTAGGVFPLSVPVVCPDGNHTRTDNVLVCYRDRWNVNHLRTIEAAYGAAPYFLFYKDELAALLLHRYERLLDLNSAILSWILSKLSASCVVCRTSSYVPSGKCASDWRDRFSPRSELPEELFEPYYQVFSNRFPFASNLSILDMLMNMGPESTVLLNRIKLSVATAN